MTRPTMLRPAAAAKRNQIVMPLRSDTQLLPTLLDRLRDDAPHKQTEATRDYSVTRIQMRNIIQRDLSFLLNTINIEEQIDRERFPDAAASTVNFGVPPLAGIFTSSRRWTDISAVISRAILDFEPRIIPETLEIKPLVDVKTDQHYHDLAFEIRGMIHMDPYPIELLVQSSLDLETSRLYASGSTHA